jgi:hypothetical protein
MSKISYEGTIDGYSFLMEEDGVIEVWSNYDSEYPESYIYLGEGSIQNQKQFEIEISSWWVRNKM